VIGGHAQHGWGRRSGALFFILFPGNCFRSGPPNWLLWFGLIFVAFVLYSPGGLVGIWATLSRRLRPAAGRSLRHEQGARFYEGSAAAGHS